jgi:prolyl-tRNA synthetase
MKDNHDKLNAKGREIVELLTKAGYRAKLDDRTVYKPGWKYNYWELKGVPLKIEIGDRDIEKNQVVISRRDTGTKTEISFVSLVESVAKLLDEIHNNLYGKIHFLFCDKEDIKFRHPKRKETENSKREKLKY